MRRNARTGLALAFLAAMASFSPATVRAQVSPQVEEELRRTLNNHAEARLRLQGPPSAIGTIMIRRPRLDSGLLIGEVEAGTVGQIEVFESRAFPLEQIRELRVRESRLIRGTLIGGAFGVALVGTLHALCARDEDCDLPYGSPAVYGLSASAFAGIGGAVATFLMGWRVVYSRPVPGLRIADSGVQP